MFDLPLFLAFMAAATILTLTPGLDTVMVLRACIASHTKVAFSAAGGIILGCLVWGAAVSLGLGVVLQASQVLYTAVKLAGACYLIWLGIGLLYKPRQQIAEGFVESSLESSVEGAGHSSLRSLAAFRQGLITNLLNPKIGIFYLSFIPQFIPAEVQVAIYSFFLASVHVAISMLWFMVLILATKQLGRWMRSPQVIARMDRLTGVVFIGFGMKLALSQG